MSANKFLKEVLGEDGAAVLSKTTSRLPVMGSVLVPRTILAWLTTQVRLGYEGSIPGLDNSYIDLHKNEHDHYSGALTVGETVHVFEDSSFLHVAASVGVALGIDDHHIDPMLKNTDLTRLGKSIDMLVKARVLSKAVADDLEKRILDPSAGITFQHQHHDLGGVGDLTHIKAMHPVHGVVGETVLEHQADGSLKPSDVEVHPNFRRMGIASAMYNHAQNLTGKMIKPSTAQTNMGQALWAGNAKMPQFGKVEAAGGAAGPQEPKQPQMPQTPQATMPSTNKTTRPPMMAKTKDLPVTKSEATRSCNECGLRHFRNDKFVGCMCFRALSKSVKTEVVGDGYVLHLGRAAWDEDSIQALMSTLKG